MSYKKARPGPGDIGLNTIVLDILRNEDFEAYDLKLVQIKDRGPGT
jgi:hypothetical protein